MTPENQIQAPIEHLFQGQQLTLIAGPCVIESFEITKSVAEFVQQETSLRNIPFIFKASFDKANRTSISSFRGPGIEQGLNILNQIRSDLGVPVLTDIHLPHQAEIAADVVDVLQIPAFLCRQTDLIVAAAKTGLPTCIKKGQFLAPADMCHVVTKFKEAGGGHLALTERGTSFGYQNLVVDMRGIEQMREETRVPIIFDATHSVQRPGAGPGVTSGDRNQAPLLARAAAAVGIDALFAEVHPNPDDALSDGPNSLTFDLLCKMLDQVWPIHQARHAAPVG